MWLVYVCLTANGKKLQARQRHTIALLSLMGGALWFLVTLVIHFYSAASAPGVVTVYLSAKELIETEPALLARIATWLEPALPYLSVAYLVVACFLFLRFYRHYYRTRQLYNTGIQKAPVEWRLFLGQALQHIGIKKKVTIWFSSLVDTPLTLGFWKPVILLPVAAVNHLNLQQAEAIILHELNHISRNDYLVNLVIACTDIILFFNPFTRFLTGIVRREREHSCDDLVLQFRYDATSYAKALLTLEQNRCGAKASLALAATGKNKQFLLNRVKRILSGENTPQPFPQRLVAFLLSALLIGFIGLYNPGKVIVKTIDDVTTPLASTENNLNFQTPPAENTVDATPPPEVVKKPAPLLKLSIKESEDEDEGEEITKLEDLIELAADVRLAAITDAVKELPIEQMASFVNAWQTIDYSFKAPEAEAPAETKDPTYTFVPSSSFDYQTLEDTTLPKKYIMTYTEQKTKEAVEKALLALKVIDWKKLEKEINANGQKIDIAKLQLEIQKAIKEVDWKKIDEETAAAMQAEQDQARFGTQLRNNVQNRAAYQEKVKVAQQQILLDRLAQHERLKEAEVEKAKTECQGATTTTKAKKAVTAKKKKIVHI
jgi:beta-lactamase regulating signal transducer with metallopeptidase domain